MSFQTTGDSNSRVRDFCLLDLSLESRLLFIDTLEPLNADTKGKT